MSTYTPVTNFQKTVGFLAHFVYIVNRKTHQILFDIYFTKPDRLLENLAHIVLSKFVVQKC